MYANRSGGMTTRIVAAALIWLLGAVAGFAAQAQEAAAETAQTSIEATIETPRAAPVRVVAGMYINDIQAIDLRTHSYVVDLYIWFRWTEPDFNPFDTFEFMNRFDPEARDEQILYDEPQEQPDGSSYNIVRYQGAFSNKFDVSQYPFDNQQIIVAVEDSEYTTVDLVYAPDKNPLVVNQEISIPGYAIGAPKLMIRDKPYSTNFGDLNEPDTTPYSRTEFIIPITRPILSGVVKSFLPVILIILCAAMTLVLDPSHVEARVGLSITALLTLVATQFTAAGNLPEVSYLTLLDQIYILSYVYILLVIGLVVRGTRLDSIGLVQGDAALTAKLAAGGPRTAILTTLAYLIAMGAILAFNLI